MPKDSNVNLESKSQKYYPMRTANKKMNLRLLLLLRAASWAVAQDWSIVSTSDPRSKRVGHAAVTNAAELLLFGGGRSPLDSPPFGVGDPSLEDTPVLPPRV